MTKKEIAFIIMEVLAKIAQFVMVIVALYFMLIREYETGGCIFVALIAMTLMDISMAVSGTKDELKRFNELAEDVLGDEEEEQEVSIDGLSQKSGICEVKK